MPADVAAVRRRTKRGSPRTWRAHGAARAAAGGERRPVRVSRRPLLRRRAAGVEQRRAARGAARARRARRARSAGSTSTPASVRAATARRSSRAGTIAGRSRARQGVVGRRRHVVPRRLVDVGAADRRQLQRRVRRMPAGATYAGIALEYGTRAVRRDAAGAARRPVARQSSRRARLRSRADQAADPRRVLQRRRRLEGHGLRAGARGGAARVGAASRASRRDVRA